MDQILGTHHTAEEMKENGDAHITSGPFFLVDIELAIPNVVRIYRVSP